MIDVDRMIKNIFNLAAQNSKIVACFSDQRNPFIINRARHRQVITRKKCELTFDIGPSQVRFEVDYCRLIALLYFALHQRECEPIQTIFYITTAQVTEEKRVALHLYELKNSFIFGGILELAVDNLISVYLPVRYCMHSLAEQNKLHLR